MQIWDKYRRSEGLLIVLSGPSGVGKDRVLIDFLQALPEISKCVTITTRVRREDEIPGKDYHFVSVAEFRKMVEEGKFLEHAEVFGNLYGTPLEWVEERLKTGKDAILKIDVQGGVAVKRQYPEAIMVFLVPPSLEELERRLRNRGTESEEQVNRRFIEARRELAYIPEYDYIVENDSVEDAISMLRCIIVAERCRIQRNNM